MQLKTHKAPHIRSKESNRTLMSDAIIAMVPLYAMAVYFYGTRALYLMAVSVGVCFILDWVCVSLSGRIPNIRDISPIVTGMIIPLLLLATISYNIIIVAAAFAILIAKHPFGGTGQNIFNPAVSGVAFATITWPFNVFSYPLPFDSIAATGDIAAKLVTSPAHTLSLGGIPSVDIMDMLLGNAPGPMGASHILVLCSCMLFLVMRKTLNVYMVASYFAGFSLMAGLFPRCSAGPLMSIAYELCSGFAMIAIVLLIGDPVTSPKRLSGKILNGFLSGVLFMGF